MGALFLPVFGCASTQGKLPAIVDIKTPADATQALFFGVTTVKTTVDQAQIANSQKILPDPDWLQLVKAEVAFKAGAKVVYDGIQVWQTRGDPGAFIAAYADFTKLFNSIAAGGK